MKYKGSEKNMRRYKKDTRFEKVMGNDLRDYLRQGGRDYIRIEISVKNENDIAKLNQKFGEYPVGGYEGHYGQVVQYVVPAGAAEVIARESYVNYVRTPIRPSGVPQPGVDIVHEHRQPRDNIIRPPPQQPMPPTNKPLPYPPKGLLPRRPRQNPRLIKPLPDQFRHPSLPPTRKPLPDFSNINFPPQRPPPSPSEIEESRWMHDAQGNRTVTREQFARMNPVLGPEGPRTQIGKQPKNIKLWETRVKESIRKRK